MSELRITEIFYSLQGESNTVGIPTVFIRLTGCPLRCQYCDTAYAFSGGEIHTIENILNKVSHFKTQYVTVTGGEPLAQKNCLYLLSELCNAHYRISLETSGAIDLSKVDSRVIKVVDIKTPGSNESQKNHIRNLEYLRSHDQVKFVICHRQDYIWSKKFMKQYELNQRCEIIFSPSYQQLSDAKLAEWILEDQLPVRFQIQLHKYLWGDVPAK